MSNRLSIFIYHLSLVTMFFWSSVSMATTLPNVDGRLKVCVQNCQYYYVLNYADSKMTDYHTYDSLVLKTNKMVNSFRAIDADIYALVEVEENDSVLSFLVNAMNADAGYTKYGFVRDGLGPYESTKGGFVYRLATIAPYGDNVVGTTENNMAYKVRNRIQAFTELSSGERFVLSVNHFKSKSGDKNGETATTRLNNANGVIARLSQTTIRNIDPDQLVVGDLNETTTEPAVQRLVSAGYAEQLERFDASAYSYYYSGNILLDHILANASMATQVVDADVYHINTDNYSGWYKATYRYSDHDPVIVGINLGKTSEIDLAENEVPISPAEAEAIYSITGQDMTPYRHHLPAGIYILRSGDQIYKVTIPRL